MDPFPHNEQQKQATTEKLTAQAESVVPVSRGLLVLLDPPELGWVLVLTTIAEQRPSVSEGAQRS